MECLDKFPRVIGSKQTKKALLKDEIATLYIAADADRKITEPLVEIACDRQVMMENVSTMKELGKKFGIDVGAAVAAILK